MTLPSRTDTTPTAHTTVDEVLSTMQGYREAFSVLQDKLHSTTLAFRECLYLSTPTCNATVETLQLLLRRSTDCYQFWEHCSRSGMLHPLHRSRIRGKLGFLQGESTATLILQVDTFKYLLITTPGTQRDEDRIRLHVHLQTELAKKAATVDSLLILLGDNLDAADDYLLTTCSDETDKNVSEIRERTAQNL